MAQRLDAGEGQGRDQADELRLVTSRLHALEHALALLRQQVQQLIEQGVAQ